MGDLHPAPAAAGGGLDDDRIADLAGDLLGLVDLVHAAVRAGNDRNAQLFRGVLGGDLVAHDADMFRLGTDEGDVVIFQHLRESGVFRQEAIAGMDGLGAGDLAGGDDRGRVEIAFRGRVRPDTDRFVGHAHMHGIGIGGRMDGDGLDAHFPGGTDHAQRDLAPVGDQDLVEHPGLIPRPSGARHIRPACRHRRECASPCRIWAKGCGSWSSSPRRSAGCRPR